MGRADRTKKFFTATKLGLLAVIAVIAVQAFQLSSMKSQLAALGLATGGIHNALVDCEAGDTISQILNSPAGSAPQLHITISGTCSENVVIRRDDVTLKGKTQADGVQGNIALLVTSGAARFRVESLTLQGKFAGLICSYGSSVVASDIIVNNSLRGVSAFYNGSCALENSVLSNNTQGIVVGDSGNIRVRGSTIERNVIGASVFTNGALTLDRSETVPQTNVSQNYVGVDISSGGSLRPVSTSISNNQKDGLVVSSNGSVYVAKHYVAEISNNGEDGIDLSDNGFIKLLPNIKVSGNQAFGVNCIQNGVIQKLEASGHAVTDNANSDFAELCGID